jgi:hypothetical protein
MNIDPINSSKLPPRSAMLLCVSILLCVQGCTVGPKYKPPVFQAPSSFKEAAPQQGPDGTVWNTAKPNDATLRGNWWEIYHESELDDLETN